jgi:membrane associated rhomboid family serine protease
LLKRSATYSLIAVICGAYLLQMVVPSIQEQLWLPSFEYLQFTNEWYRLFTVALTHGGLLHLGFNMYSLLVLGNPLEAAFGKQKFLIVFFFSLFTGSLTSAYFASLYSASVGASGAIFGLFGALAIVGLNSKNLGIGVDFRSIVVIIGINFAFGFAMGGVDWRAHLGGLIGGVVAAQLVMKQPRY